MLRQMVCTHSELRSLEREALTWQTTDVSSMQAACFRLEKTAEDLMQSVHDATVGACSKPNHT